nr:MAG TPA: Organic solute transporter subunit beta protein [Caudoviricetes sp.]
MQKKLQTKKATKFAQELFFNAIMGVSLVALIFGFVILIKVLIG